MSAVLRHVAKYRPEWRVDFQAEEGRHCVGRGIVANTFAFGEPQPSPHYDAEVEIRLFDTWANWGDRPNTRVSSCLHERFNLRWDRECGRYQVQVSEETKHRAYLELVSTHRHVGVGRAVALHYQGDSSKAKKDLSQGQASAVCDHIYSLGRVPFVMGRHNPWGADAEMNCAVIAQCEAFVGIDSGPSKCASATDTPALVVWTGHSPIAFHDPADNTTHLIPFGYKNLHPVVNDPQVITWFESHYNVRKYEGDPVVEIKGWLKEVLR